VVMFWFPVSLWSLGDGGSYPLFFPAGMVFRLGFFSLYGGLCVCSRYCYSEGEVLSPRAFDSNRGNVMSQVGLGTMYITSLLDPLRMLLSCDLSIPPLNHSLFDQFTSFHFSSRPPFFSSHQILLLGKVLYLRYLPRLPPQQSPMVLFLPPLCPTEVVLLSSSFTLLSQSPCRQRFVFSAFCRCYVPPFFPPFL